VSDKAKAWMSECPAEQKILDPGKRSESIELSDQRKSQIIPNGRFESFLRHWRSRTASSRNNATVRLTIITFTAWRRIGGLFIKSLACSLVVSLKDFALDTKESWPAGG
jgi:hypothetical protein